MIEFFYTLWFRARDEIRKDITANLIYTIQEPYSQAHEAQ